MIDIEGFRENVGIILCNKQRRLLWARRVGQNAWQFPQGGIRDEETPEQAMYRELREEIGLDQNHVKVLGRTRDWVRYRLPKRLIRHSSLPLCVGQKQIWFLLAFDSNDSHVRFDMSDEPEFDSWRWIHYWRPVREVVPFKRRVYSKVLKAFAPMLFPDKFPERSGEITITRLGELEFLP